MVCLNCHYPLFINSENLLILKKQLSPTVILIEPRIVQVPVIVTPNPENIELRRKDLNTLIDVEVEQRAESKIIARGWRFDGSSGLIGGVIVFTGAAAGIAY